MSYANKTSLATKLDPYPFEPAASWKETTLISAVALAALAGFSQVLVGSFSLGCVFGFLGVAAYIGYLSEKNIVQLNQQKELHKALHRSADQLNQECLTFRSENQTLSSTNTSLTEQVTHLETKLGRMQSLLTKLESSASLTQTLLTSCIDVSSSQKNTEKRIQTLVDRLEKTTPINTKLELEKQLQRVDSAIHSMEKQIKQFFLHDSNGTRLVQIKEELSHTSKDLTAVKIELERVQKELSDTSARLEKTSYDLDSKLKRLSDQESKLSGVKKLTPLVLNLLEKPEIEGCLSYREKQWAESLHKNWSAIEA